MRGLLDKVFVIAEAGVNHNGSLELAKKLIDVAVDAGAVAVKFQTFTTKDLVIPKTPKISYQRNISKGTSQQEMLKKLELKHEDFKILKKYCNKKKIVFLSTPHTEDAIDFLDDLVPVYKIGSGDLNNAPFLKKVAQKKKPIILGTGMSTLVEVKEALNTIYREGKRRVILLHCTTSYPCSLDEVNLRAMVTMKERLRVEVGYSDHTLGIIAPIIAVTLGAVVIEKHLTLDRDFSGPDHRTSLESGEFKEMVENIRKVEIILGSKEKCPAESERKMMKLARKSIVAVEDIFKGEQINPSMLAIKRPGTGIEPKFFEEILKKTPTKKIKKNSTIKWNDFAGMKQTHGSPNQDK